VEVVAHVTGPPGHGCEAVVQVFQGSFASHVRFILGCKIQPYGLGLYLPTLHGGVG
jgi:hypothetical protein